MRAGLGGSVRPLSPAVPLPPQVYNTFPSIMHHLPGPHKRVLADCQKLKDHIREKVQFHQLTLDSSCPRDYIDCFLMKAEKVAGLRRGAAPQPGCSLQYHPDNAESLPTTPSLQEKGSPENMYSHEDLIMSVFNLFGAGTVTTSNTLVFFLLMLAKHPHIQGMASKHSCSVPEELTGQRVPALEGPIWGQTKIIPWGHPRVGAVRYRFPQAGGSGCFSLCSIPARADGPALACGRCSELA